MHPWWVVVIKCGPFFRQKDAINVKVLTLSWEILSRCSFAQNRPCCLVEANCWVSGLSQHLQELMDSYFPDVVESGGQHVSDDNRRDHLSVLLMNVYLLCRMAEMFHNLKRKAEGQEIILDAKVSSGYGTQWILSRNSKIKDRPPNPLRNSRVHSMTWGEGRELRYIMNAGSQGSLPPSVVSEVLMLFQSVKFSFSVRFCVRLVAEWSPIMFQKSRGKKKSASAIRSDPLKDWDWDGAQIHFLKQMKNTFLLAVRTEGGQRIMCLRYLWIPPFVESSLVEYGMIWFFFYLRLRFSRNLCAVLA